MKKSQKKKNHFSTDQKIKENRKWVEENKDHPLMKVLFGKLLTNEDKEIVAVAKLRYALTQAKELSPALIAQSLRVTLHEELKEILRILLIYEQDV